jgi:hypothetical protein
MFWCEHKSEGAQWIRIEQKKHEQEQETIVPFGSKDFQIFPLPFVTRFS